MTPFQQKQLIVMRQMEQTLQNNPLASQTVSMQKDYVTDTQLCLAAVSFLPNDLATIIDTQLIKPLQSIDPTQYFFPIDALHLTIQNIRVINDPPHFDAGTIEHAKTVFSTVIPHHNPQQFALTGLLTMPTSIAVIALVTPDFNHLSYFSDAIIFANITICRYTKIPNKKWFDFVEKIKNKPIGNFIAKTVSLIETNAGCHPSKTTSFGTYNFKEN